MIKQNDKEKRLVMNYQWRLFLGIESLLLLFSFFQLIRNPELLIFFILGLLFMYSALKKRKQAKLRSFLFFDGLLFVIISLANTAGFWLVSVSMIVFFTFFTPHTFFHIKKGFKLKKSLEIIETVEPTKKGGKRYVRPFFSNKRIGSDQVFEWEDINLTFFSGDTIIDLGNTLLPREDNVILIRKGFGKTRVLVPTGIGLFIEHSTFYGTLTFENEQYEMKNESIRLYSDNYDVHSRRLKLVTSSFVGDLEVIVV